MEQHKRRIFFLMLMLALVITAGFAAPVAAFGIHVDLGKIYQFRNASVRYIDVIDVLNLSLSDVRMRNTTTVATDIKIIHVPQFNQVTRQFMNTTGNFNNVTFTVSEANPPPLDWSTLPNYLIYTKPAIPSFDITVPGQVGNPVVIKYNESWSKADASSIDAFLRTSEFAYLYKNRALAYINATTDTYRTYQQGTEPLFNSSNTNMNDITFTLSMNKVELSPTFHTHNRSAENLGLLYTDTLPSRGKYYASAMEYNPDTHTINLYAMYPVIILDQNTLMRWTVGGTSYDGVIPIYDQSVSGPVNLTFNPDNTDTARIVNITYLLINKTAIYNMNIMVDPDLLAQRAETRWSGFTPASHISELLYEGIRHDIGTPFNYTLNAIGGLPAPVPANQWSVIAISPGYGISGNNTINPIAIPAANMSTLIPGTYRVYLMGTDTENNVIALDQKDVVVQAGGGGGGTITVNVHTANGTPWEADNISLSNWSSWSGLYTTSSQNATFANLLSGVNNADVNGHYLIQINKTGYFNLSVNATAFTGQSNSVTVNLTQLGQLITPVAVVSENGTRLQMDTMYIGNVTAQVPKKAYVVYNFTIVGNDHTAIALEIPMPLQLGKFSNITLDDKTPVPFTFINGTFSINSGIYVPTNATLIIYPPSKMNGRGVNITLFGTVRGDANNDQRITVTDALQSAQAAVNLLHSLTTYNSADVNGGNRFTVTDTLLIARRAVSLLNENYQ